MVASGRKNVGAADNQVMPAFGTNPNVMCYLDDIYTYLRARGTDVVPRGRPAKKEAKSDAYAEAEKACMGAEMRAALAATLCLWLTAPAMAQVADLVDRDAFRVCADPANVPLSSKDGSGFENRIAELFAKELDVPLQYTWFSPGDRLSAPDAQHREMRCGDRLCAEVMRWC